MQKLWECELWINNAVVGLERTSSFCTQRAVCWSWASEEGLVAFCFQDLEVGVEGTPLLLLQFCQPIIKHKTASMQLIGHLQKLVFILYRGKVSKQRCWLPGVWWETALALVMSPARYLIWLFKFRQSISQQVYQRIVPQLHMLFGVWTASALTPCKSKAHCLVCLSLFQQGFQALQVVLNDHTCRKIGLHYNPNFALGSALSSSSWHLIRASPDSSCLSHSQLVILANADM